MTAHAASNVTITASLLVRVVGAISWTGPANVGQAYLQSHGNPIVLDAGNTIPSLLANAGAAARTVKTCGPLAVRVAKGGAVESALVYRRGGTR